MTRGEFRRRNGEHWKALEHLLALLEVRQGSGGSSLSLIEDTVDLRDFDRLYRLACKHLALARQRMYGRELVAYLNGLALRAHHELYGRPPSPWRRAVRFFVADFPAAVRANTGLVVIAALLFVGPLVAMGVAVHTDPDLVHSVMPSEEILEIEEMYAPDSRYRTEERRSAGDLQMFGFYIMQNIGVAFRTFAGGILLGAGSVFFLAWNGVYIGSIAAHVSGLGYGSTFFPFVVGHSALELTAIVLAGAAGLNLGKALVRPGRATRIVALKEAAGRSVLIVCGAAGMLVAAAYVEAFWSSAHVVSDRIKYVAGAVMWLAVAGYFWLGGRDRAA